jgi:hypothetical protein
MIKILYVNAIVFYSPNAVLPHAFVEEENVMPKHFEHGMSIILVHITPEQCSKEEILSETPSEIIAC